MQKDASRFRSAAYPYELAYRLINMFLLKNDLVFDPFLGTGTTIMASITSQRDSIGYEIDPEFKNLVEEMVLQTPVGYHYQVIENRVNLHKEFIEKQKALKGEQAFKYTNSYMNIPVLTRQETDMSFSVLKEISKDEK